MPTRGVGRRALLGAGVAAPLAVAVAALARGARGALVGARPFADSRVEGTIFPKRLVDATGSARALERPPERIVSTYLCGDEMLAALVPVSRVVGVSAYADDAGASNCLGVYPPSVARLRAEPERILAVEPDLVCVSHFVDVESMRVLTAVGLPLLRWSRFDSFGEVLQGLRMLGDAVGAEARADALAVEVEGQLAALERRLRGIQPLRVLYYDPPRYTMGGRTLVDEILARAGARNVAAELGMSGPGEISMEMVLALQPEAIVMPRYDHGWSARELLAQDPMWRRMPAATTARVYEVPAAWISAVSHHAARGLGRLARLLHPEAFGDATPTTPTPPTTSGQTR